MNRTGHWLCLCAAMFAAATAQAAEIVLERSAVEKLVVQAMFSNAGRHELQRGACYAYLESPSVELKVIVRRAPVDGTCSDQTSTR